MDEADALTLHLEHETELFLCADNSASDSEWRLYGYETDGTRKVVTYEVTEETPEDRSIILKNFDSGDEYVVTWNVSVTKRIKD